MPDLPIDLTRSRTDWPRRIRIARLLWSLFQPLFWRGWGRLGNRPRLWALRLFGARIASPCLILGGAKVLMPWNLTIGRACALGADVDVYNFAPITIGDHTVISQRTTLCTGSHDYTHPHHPLIWKPITIGSGVWVCAEVFVHPGVTIADGTVVGARSVVTRDLPAWTVCAGFPCVALKPRVLRVSDSPG
jgi:putative colanic acid biosynthesis acetyltransferase WcaF